MLSVRSSVCRLRLQSPSWDIMEAMFWNSNVSLPFINILPCPSIICGSSVEGTLNNQRISESTALLWFYFGDSSRNWKVGSCRVLGTVPPKYPITVALLHHPSSEFSLSNRWTQHLWSQDIVYFPSIRNTQRVRVDTAQMYRVLYEHIIYMIYIYVIRNRNSFYFVCYLTTCFGLYGPSSGETNVSTSILSLWKPSRYT
jgi:hypothetical protein